eukprot:194639-Prymnesium_polylepis.1
MIHRDDHVRVRNDREIRRLMRANTIINITGECIDAKRPHHRAGGVVEADEKRLGAIQITAVVVVNERDCSHALLLSFQMKCNDSRRERQFERCILP